MENDIEKKYEPFKDPYIYIAFFLGGSYLIPFMLFSGSFSTVLLQAIFSGVWLWWIYSEKGKKGSLLTGFFIGLLYTFILFVIIFVYDLITYSNSEIIL